MGGGGGLTAFGAGYFDDSGDVPGIPVLCFTLRGRFRPDDGSVELEKVAPAHSRSLCSRPFLIPPLPFAPCR